MKKLVKSYREMNDSLKKRPEFTLGVIFGMIVTSIAIMAMVELGGTHTQAPKPPELGWQQSLLFTGRLGLSVIVGALVGMTIAGLITTWAWHSLKRNSQYRAKYPDWTPDEVEAPQESP